MAACLDKKNLLDYHRGLIRSLMHTHIIMYLSIVIPTYARPQKLQKTIDSLRNLDTRGLPPCELLVVNNSPQRSISSILNITISGIEVREIKEPVIGLSQARNSGIAHSCGTWLAFVDDDVTLHPFWLKAIVEGINNYPEATFFGGRIIGSIEGPIPEWCMSSNNIQPWLHGVIGNYDLGASDQEYNPNTMEEFFGANFICRKTLLEEHGTFNTMLGLSGNRSRVAGEDTEVVRRLQSNGANGYYLAEALVWHRFPSIKLDPDYIYSYYRRCGRSAAFMDYWYLNLNANKKSLDSRLSTKFGYLASLLLAIKNTDGSTNAAASIELKAKITKTQAYIIELLNIKENALSHNSDIFYTRFCKEIAASELTYEQCVIIKEKLQANA